MPTNCPSGKVVNPATGRCVYKDSPVLKKTLNPLKKQKIINVVSPTDISKTFVKCDTNKVINPKTKRCVQLKNKDIQSYLMKGWKLYSGPSVPSVPIKKVPINDPKNVNDPNIKVLVPPDPKNTIKLVYCGKGKVINPQTGRCILLSGPIGKKLMSKPYVIVNPPSKPQKSPLFIPVGPKPNPVKGPKDDRVPKVPKIPFPKMKPEEIRTALDTDGDNYVSIREYLDVAESLGPNEKGKGPHFAFYNQRDLGIVFILTLIKELKGPIHHIGCIPLFHLCVYQTASGSFYTMENIKHSGKLACPYSSDYYSGNSINTYASITIINAPYKKMPSNKMKVLTPPNLPELIKKCEDDNKYMVVCDLTLLNTENFLETSHANVLIFDTRRKTIERFDPHGGSEYSKVKLAYDSQGDSTGRKDFMYGKNKFGLDKLNKIKSNALFDQVIIDNKLNQHLIKILPNYTYYGTNDTTPYLGPQIKVDEYDGLCVTWSCMYMILRLLNPDLNPADVTVKMIDGSPKQIKNRVLRFQKFIIRTLQNSNERVK